MFDPAVSIWPILTGIFQPQSRPIKLLEERPCRFLLRGVSKTSIQGWFLAGFNTVNGFILKKSLYNHTIIFW